MSRPSNLLFVHLLLAIACLSAVQFLLPAETATWRRVMAAIFSVGLGYQLATALLYTGGSRAGQMRAWVDGLAFPLLIAAFQMLPQTNGWILLAAGLLWRPLVLIVIRHI